MASDDLQPSNILKGLMKILLWNGVPLSVWWLEDNLQKPINLIRAWRQCSDASLKESKEAIDACRTDPSDMRTDVELPKLLKLFESYLDQTVTVIEAIKEFTLEEQGTILELARFALSDADTFDYFVEKLDLSDAEVKALQGKLEKATT